MVLTNHTHRHLSHLNYTGISLKENKKWQMIWICIMSLKQQESPPQCWRWSHCVSGMSGDRCPSSDLIRGLVWWKLPPLPGLVSSWHTAPHTQKFLMGKHFSLCFEEGQPASNSVSGTSCQTNDNATQRHCRERSGTFLNFHPDHHQSFWHLLWDIIACVCPCADDSIAAIYISDDPNVYVLGMKWYWETAYSFT